MRLCVPFDLDFSLCCGQVFRWQKIDDWWYGVVGSNVFKIRQCGAKLEFEGVDDEFVTRYFGLDDDLEQITQCIDKDPCIHEALRCYKGLRIVRQEPWECLINFVCATYKSIAAIEDMLRKLSAKFGERKVFDGREFCLFPSPEKLAFASEKGLRDCGLGYRAKYVRGTAQKIREGKIQLESLKTMPYLEARKVLVGLPGVGLKVADCVLLFSLEKTEAFPVDVWVRRIIINHYADKLPQPLAEKLLNHKTLSPGDYEKVNAFGRSYFGQYAGYAQEYLFHYERSIKKDSNNKCT